ncbi:hypothetical protein [Clostridium sp. UBA6640]|uniref:hypothetical protein n=1 Tax=Clostridium sp. UBA6640 TaxID=1946370 RepID=UPI0025C60773|nr:hypothetical protein [Clostridium sp. UBA6640]
MSKKSSNNNELLSNSKANSSPKIYHLLVKLVNDEREDLAELVLKVDYLLEYASRCIKQKDFTEAKEVSDKAKNRINTLKDNYVDTEYLDYLYEGIVKKIKI